MRNLKECLDNLECGTKTTVTGNRYQIEKLANRYGMKCWPHRKYTVRLQKDGTLALWRHDYFGK